MTVRRKSNWYIYFIAFAVALAFAVMVIITFRGYLFPQRSAEVGLTSSGELSENFTPTAEHNLTMLAMIADEENGIPQLYILAAYNAVDSRLTLIPLPNGISVSGEGRTLTNVYAAQGGAGAAQAVSNALGIPCDKYAAFNRNTFIGLLTAYGNVRYDVPRTVIITDGVMSDTVNAGEQFFSSEKVFRYIMLAEFDDGESYRFNMVGDILSQLINQNSMYADGSLMDTYASYFSNSFDTNITQLDYEARKAAFLNTAQYTANPAEYYVPYGEYTDDGGFVISANSITTIRQKTSQDE